MDKKKCSSCVYFEPHYALLKGKMLIGFCNWPSKEGDPVVPSAIGMDRLITKEDEERECSHWEMGNLCSLINDFLSQFISLKETGEAIGQKLAELIRPLIPDIECNFISDVAVTLESPAKKQERTKLDDTYRDKSFYYRVNEFPLYQILSGFYGPAIFESNISLTWEELRGLIEILEEAK